MTARNMLRVVLTPPHEEGSTSHSDCEPAAQEPPLTVEFDRDAPGDLETLQFQVFSVTDIPPEQQLLRWNGTPLRRDTDVAIIDPAVCQELHLSVSGDAPARAGEEEKEEGVDLTPLQAMFPQYSQKVLAAALSLAGGDLDTACSMLFEDGDTLAAQVEPVPTPSQESGNLDTDRKRMAFLQRIQAHVDQVMTYELQSMLDSAREVIPLSTILLKAEEAFNASQQSGGGYPSDHEYQVRELLRWFKHEFFSWVNEPKCQSCQSGGTKLVWMAPPSEEEQSFGAGRVEVYQCQSCQSITRFPRYNNAGKLLETRRGRCGEWAQAFTLCCRAMGWKARFVLDFTDHAWTEVFCEGLQRWVHCDPCENIFDAPFTYECGWNKKLTYVLGFSNEEVVDVTRRYTKNFEQVLTRRTDCSEEFCAQCLEMVSEMLMSHLPPHEVVNISQRRAAEQEELRQNVIREELKEEERRQRISGNE